MAGVHITVCLIQRQKGLPPLDLEHNKVHRKMGHAFVRFIGQSLGKHGSPPRCPFCDHRFGRNDVPEYLALMATEIEGDEGACVGVCARCGGSKGPDRGQITMAIMRWVATVTPDVTGVIWLNQ